MQYGFLRLDECVYIVTANNMYKVIYQLKSSKFRWYVDFNDAFIKFDDALIKYLLRYEIICYIFAFIIPKVLFAFRSD